ncbi:MAG TPA: hypothetical protein VFE37_08445 [Chloroflexota bacterium]|nr:hypothetical protein [Chloroflexota bacterium]
MRNWLAPGWRAARPARGGDARGRWPRIGLALTVALLGAIYPGVAGRAGAITGLPPAPAVGGTDTRPGALLASPAAQIDPAVVVQITNPRPGQHLTGRVEITGYAADQRSPDGSGLNERDIQLYVNDSSDPWNIFDYAVGGEPSPDAAAALGPRFSQAGFWDAWETCTFPEGPYKLIVWVSSLVTPGARNVASVDVYVDACQPGTVVSQAEFESEAGGVFTMRLSGPETRQYLFDPIYADFAAGIDARCTNAAVDCSYGLQFRELPGPGGSRTNSYYRFTVDPTDGTFMLGYSPPGDDPIVPVVPWTSSPTIAQGTAANHLAVIVQGNWLRLFINGQQVGEARDERRPWGQIGFVAGTSESGRVVEATFDNFLVSTPGPAELLPPIFPGPGVGVVAPPSSGPSSAPSGGPSNAPSSGPSTVLLRDDFSDPNSGWPQQSSDPSRRRVGYENGEYRIVRVAGSGGSPLVFSSERFGDALIEIDARLAPPTENAYVYLDFRRQDDGSHYSFMVDPNDSTFTLRRNTADDGTALIPWTSAPAIQGGTARNRLGVRARGAELIVYVNGQEVGRAQDGTLREGTLAFGVGSLNDGPADGRFGNLLVSSVN